MAMRGLLAAFFVALSLATSICAQDKPPVQLGLPWGSVTRLASPDGAYVLFGLPYRQRVNTPLVELWFENTRTKQRQMVLTTGGTLSAFWSPDGSAFVVNPGISDQAQTYIYDAATLARLDVGREIMAADPSVARFAPGKAHSYFTPERWENNWDLIVHLHGHTDGPPNLCFSIVYRASRAGAIEKMSENVFHIDPANLCRE